MGDARKLDGKPVRNFARRSAWATWLRSNHAKSTGVWVRIARKGSTRSSVTQAEALEVALCYGWIDGQARSEGADFWLQKFTPRGKRSIWSKRNREKVAVLMKRGEMRAPGLAEVERAKADLDSRNRYAVLFRIQTAKKAETRARRIAQFVAMLSRNERVYD